MRNNGWIIVLLLIIVGVLLWFLFAPPAFVEPYLGGNTATTTQNGNNNGGGNTNTGAISTTITRGNNTALSAQVQPETPAPGATVGRTFTVSGKAPGGWFFEASFPIEVKDANGNVLLSTYVEAQGEWMTPNLVPYSRTITVPGSYTGEATVILHRDNASALPENDDFVSYKIKIQ